MRLSEASYRFSVPLHHLQYWKKTGLIGKERDDLDFVDLVKIKFIQNCKKNHISLKKIRRTLADFELGGGSERWHEALHVYRPGVLLSRSDEGLLLSPEGQLFLEYGQPTGPVVSPIRREDPDKGAADRLQALEEEYVFAISKSDRDELKTVLKKILKIRPEHTGALIEFGNIHFEAGKYDEALLYYERAAATTPNCVEAIYNIANIYFKQKKYAAAIRNFIRCIEYDPDFPESYYNLGLLYYSLRYFDKANHFLEVYLDMDPDSSWSDQARRFIEEMREMTSVNHGTLFHRD